MENKMKNKIIYGLMLTVLSFGALAQNTPAGSTAVSGTNHSGDTTLIFKDMGQDPGASQGANTVDLQQIVFPVASGGGPVSVGSGATGGGSTSGGTSTSTTSTTPSVVAPPVVSTVTPTCSNGASNYPTCSLTVGGTPGITTTPTCSNGASNYPTCTLPTPTCANGATNYPTCTLPTTSPIPNNTPSTVSVVSGGTGCGMTCATVVVNGVAVASGNVASGPATITSSKTASGTTTTITQAVTSNNGTTGTLTRTTTTTAPVTTGSYGTATSTGTTKTVTSVNVNGTTATATKVCTWTTGFFSTCRTHSGRCTVYVCK
jgi:hypothetical protein